MLAQIIRYSVSHKLIVFLFTSFIVGFGIYSLTQISIGAVPDITNNQVQVLTTSRNLSTSDVEQFITYPIELEMANLPGVKEIRSISKFGLSVVTIVFDDDMGTYLPRQLISEKIKSASEKIPQGFGSPEMGPVSTGLGEIYQYVLDVRPEYKDKYNAMDLRTIQDWIVKRQLSGIPGVVEVNTWGGFLKQYEVAVNPQKLRSLNLTIGDVFGALQNNNSIAGGGYIEKASQAYYIRAEGLVKSIEDIENIPVKTGEIPILVRDVANVNHGYATRFGAITGNGEGEKVLGQVMMLKGANSLAVINAVKNRVDAIQSSLPEGVYINGFLERSALIKRTTNTIIENLLLGCLIVIFVVVLLLGNIRSGLVVASVIPLSLLFALSMMNIFGVDANLMSMGAIDFGIIIDGAVIIVEYIAFKLTASQGSANLSKGESQHVVDEVAYEGAVKMMRSAVFGQLIIIIVFIPILSLTDIEGKMFRPMALTFVFALLGAMILCFTYIPALSALVLKPQKRSSKNISVRLISFLQKLYEPTLRWALKWKPAILATAVLVLVFTGFLYTRMGGEFVPTLDEGDFVIQPALKTGTSLSETVNIITKMEQVIKTFPEVNQVVTRIGAAEVPTDPMSMEETDMIITLKPPSEWTSASTKDELADQIKHALNIIPGVEYEFTQPIEMRFNELVTGVRADLAIKIFGEDLDVLQAKGLEIKDVIEDIEGASDIAVEKITGLPQMRIQYDRSKIAKYGLSLETVNQSLAMGFAGLSAGNIFEGEKRFDLVVRFDENYRHSIDDLKNIFVALPSGGQVPISEVANISYSKGPAKISRDDTKRRIVVGVNVRNRDLESVVSDVQKRIEKSVDLPVGYSISYGGQFENLQNATNRLKVAVPIALLLIFILLYFAFSSIKEALLIFSAIPLASVGGVLLLYIRDLPFSISAGVGFIALFGIAVLNGIVLIEHFKTLKERGVTDVNERVIHGASQRMRPVLLTAFAAALGFLPMAISHSAGAEVQRPLATVVIGGLFTATLLTLIVLPLLYTIFDKEKIKVNNNGSGVLLVLIMSVLGTGLNAQSVEVNSFDELKEIAIANNNSLKIAALEIQRAEMAAQSSNGLDPIEFYYNRDPNNIKPNGGVINILGVNQSFNLPKVYKDQKNMKKAEVNLQQKRYARAEKKLQKQLAGKYYEIVYLQHLQKEYVYLDSLYSALAKAQERTYDLGGSSYLEKLTIDAQKQKLSLWVNQNQKEVQSLYQELQALVQSQKKIIINERELQLIDFQVGSFDNHPSMTYFDAVQSIQKWSIQNDKNQGLPIFNVEYFTTPDRDTGLENNFHGFSLGVGIPLYRKSINSKVKASEMQSLIIDEQRSAYLLQMNNQQKLLLTQLEKHQMAVSYYQNEGMNLAASIIRHASISYENGEIDLFEYVRALESAKQMELDYLRELHQEMQILIQLAYFTLD